MTDTPRRTVRISDELWTAAVAKAAERGESLPEEIRKFLRRYVAMMIDPVDPEFEMEVSRLAGKRREDESVEDHLKRISRVRAGLRELQYDRGGVVPPVVTWVRNDSGEAEEVRPA